MSLTISLFNSIAEKIDNKSCRICVVGVGYVGEELAYAFSSSVFKNVSAYDTDSEKINELKEKYSKEEYVSTKFHISSDPTLLKYSDVICITVPTPLYKSSNKPDYSYIEQAIREINNVGVKNKLVVLESTVSPFTTLDRLLPKLQSKELAIGSDFFLGFSPERIDPNNQEYNIRNTTKIVSGVTSNCKDLVSKLYSKITKVHEVINTQTAEFIKLYENTFRNVNVGLACEMSELCSKQGINIHEVIEAASTKEFGFMKFYPGLIGGHCIPLDVHYLKKYSDDLKVTLNIVESAIKVHEIKIENVYKAVRDSVGGSVKGKKILIMGMSYKPDVSDYRESAGLKLYQIFKKKHSVVNYYDSHVKQIKVGDSIIKPVDPKESVLREMDCVLILQKHTRWKEKFFSSIWIDSKNIVDCVNAYSSLYEVIKDLKVIKV